MIHPVQRLRVLRAEIENAQRNANAEQAIVATGATENPWSGAISTLAELETEKRQLELRAEGQLLLSKVEQLRQLDAELIKAEKTRVVADEAVRGASEHAAVQRWMKAGSIARAIGVGYDFETAFSKWYLSGKERFAGAPACVSYFCDKPQTHPGLRVDEKNDRAHIIEWHEAKGAAQATLIHWDSLAQSRALLLRESPELAAVA